MVFMVMSPNIPVLQVNHQYWGLFCRSQFISEETSLLTEVWGEHGEMFWHLLNLFLVINIHQVPGFCPQLSQTITIQNCDSPHLILSKTKHLRWPSSSCAFCQISVHVQIPVLGKIRCQNYTQLLHSYRILNPESPPKPSGFKLNTSGNQCRLMKCTSQYLEIFYLYFTNEEIIYDSNHIYLGFSLVFNICHSNVFLLFKINAFSYKFS